MNIINRFTLQTLKKNKVRTAVTIIGIILSTAMFTAITSIIFSLQQYSIDMEVDYSGAWHGKVDELTPKQAQKLQKLKEITKSTKVTNVGYAKLKGCINENKPYLFIESIGSDYTKQMPIKITKGRMPENRGELVIPEHLSSNGNVNYKIGDTVELKVGVRDAGEGYILGQNTSYTKEEKISNAILKSYTIVGICERPDKESYSAPGYTAFTTGEKETMYSCSVIFQLEKPINIDKVVNRFLKKLPKNQNTTVEYSAHSKLLGFMGQSPNDNYMSVLAGMGAILICIIMVASISLIYNAFSISVSERTKQFGLLKSIGATKKQIRKSVLFEAFSLCLIGIPLGIGSGLLGIGITLHFIGGLLAPMIAVETSVQLKLTISVWSILIASVIALVTVVISAMLPARRAVKMPAIQALRESNDIKLNKRKIRSSKLIYTLFGFEGMLANKNFKRNRKKYRLTVASLALSVVLFISTSTFTSYMSASTTFFKNYSAFDISLNATSKELGKNNPDDTKLQIKQLKHIDEIAYSQYLQGYTQIDTAYLSSGYLNFLKKNFPDNFNSDKKKVLIPAVIAYIDDNTYKKYLEKQNLDIAHYMDNKNYVPLIWDLTNTYNNDGTLYTENMLSKKGFNGTLYSFNTIKGYTPSGTVTDADKLSFAYSNSEYKEITIPKAKALTEISIADSKVMDATLPLGVSDMRWGLNMTFVLPYSALQKLPAKVLPDIPDINFHIAAKNHTQATTELQNFFKNEASYSNSIASRVYDERAQEETSEALILIIDIFSYGFITLITLIVIANVFNTISTNIQLRRKEFAMLKSVGMTKKGFDHMMNYECLLYGIKGLLFGLPISFGLSYLMYKSLQSGWNASFYIPWLYIIIAVISVFVIVFASMIYSMSKIKKDNPIEALRNDNL